ncbi:MAG: DUF5711 family protein [Otoolea sp.]|nr:DUF5711 family protein [Clostridiaceae bacterium]MDY5484007.1 DUF5711 family protein [Clostridium sp.]
MSAMDAMNREQKKRQLKRRMIEPGTPPPADSGRRISHGEKEEAIVRRAERRTRRRRLWLVLFAAVLLLLASLGVWQYKTAYRYTEYTVAWEREIPASESGFTGYERFGDNLIKYTKDGASYLDRSGKAVWSISYQLKSPICYVNGEYAAIADQQGNAIYICDKNGCQGQATTILPILRVSVSAYGVAAALVEDSTASYVTFYKKDGSELDWAIKTVMSGNGYLMDVSLSPEGSQVMLSDLYLQDGSLKNRVVFYNFSEFGKSYPDRLVGGFNEFGDSICPRVRFLDEEHACAFADSMLAFFSLENVTSPELTVSVPFETEVQSIAYSKEYVAVVTDSASGEYDSCLEIYRADGTRTARVEFTYPWQNIDIDGDFVILYNDNSCRVYSISGKERFSGEFDFSVSKITRGSRFNSLLLTGGDRMREIHLK